MESVITRSSTENLTVFKRIRGYGQHSFPLCINPMPCLVRTADAMVFIVRSGLMHTGVESGRLFLFGFCQNLQ